MISFPMWADALRPRMSDNDPAAGLLPNVKTVKVTINKFSFDTTSSELESTNYIQCGRPKAPAHKHETIFRSNNLPSIFFLGEFWPRQVESWCERVFVLCSFVLIRLLIEHSNFVTQRLLKYRMIKKQILDWVTGYNEFCRLRRRFQGFKYRTVIDLKFSISSSHRYNTIFELEWVWCAMCSCIARS